MRKIAVKRTDGGVSIIIPGLECTPELLLRDALAVDGYVSHREIEDNEFPTDRYFREAWTDDLPTQTVDIDFTKAVEIKKDKLRYLRIPKLKELDVQFLIALEQGDVTAQAEITAKKQELRDITLNLPADLNDLRNYHPDCLN